MVIGAHSNIFLHKDDVSSNAEIALPAADKGEELGTVPTPLPKPYRWTKVRTML